MIKFEHNHGDLRAAVFGGNVSDLCSDICLEISLIYGAMHTQNKNVAEDFRKALILGLTDPDLGKVVFSDDLYKSVVKSKQYVTGSVSVKDPKEFERQLKELLGEDE